MVGWADTFDLIDDSKNREQRLNGSKKWIPLITNCHWFNQLPRCCISNFIFISTNISSELKLQINDRMTTTVEEEALNRTVLQVNTQPYTELSHHTSSFSLSFLVLLCLVLSYSMLSCPALSCPVLFYAVFLVLFYAVLSCPAPWFVFVSSAVQHYAVLRCPMLSCLTQSYDIVFCPMLSFVPYTILITTILR